VATRRKRTLAPDESLFSAPRSAPVPFAFVLDELDALEPYTKPMFGCVAVYVGERIVFILRDRPTRRDDNGVWVATTREHHASLRAELPGLRSIGSLAGGAETGWQNLPADDEGFEEAVLRACALVRAGDPRIGKIPQRRGPRRAVPLANLGSAPRGGPPRQGPPLQGPPTKGPPTKPPPSRTVRRPKPRR
jgi:hypothetical protein